MVTYQRFEELPVWQAAAELYDRVDDFIHSEPVRLRPSFRDQLERATLSISNNIAEGFERGTTRELLAFIYIARGSAGEVRSMLMLLGRRPGNSILKPDLSRLVALVESCSRQLHAWAESLQNSEITGTRNQSQKTRQDYQRQQERKKFDAELQDIMTKNLALDHPLRQRER